MLSRLLDLLAPPRCAACGTRAPLPWCADCLAVAAGLQLTTGCRRCAGSCEPGDPLCPLRGTGLGRTVAAFAYTDVVATTVVAAKVGGQHALWAPLGSHLGSRVRAAGTDADVVVPVPSEPGRVRRRGFDHTLLLARAVAAELAVPVLQALRVRRGTADRVVGGGPELPDAAIRALVPLAGRLVLVVDDVLTTGATLRATTAVLGTAGARAIDAAVLARALAGGSAAAGSGASTTTIPGPAGQAGCYGRDHRR